MGRASIRSLLTTTKRTPPSLVIKTRERPTWSGALSGRDCVWAGLLNGLGRGDARRNCGTPVKRVAAAGFLLVGLIDFDRAFEVSAVLDHDSRGGQVTVDRTILLDFNSVLRAKVAL